MKYIITPNTTKEELIEKGFVGYSEEEYIDMLKPYEVDDTDFIDAHVPTPNEYYSSKDYHHFMFDFEPFKILLCVAWLDDKYIPEVYWNDYFVESIEISDNKIWFICNHYDHFDKRDKNNEICNTHCHTKSPIRLDASRCIPLFMAW